MRARYSTTKVAPAASDGEAIVALPNPNGSPPRSSIAASRPSIFALPPTYVVRSGTGSTTTTSCAVACPLL